MSAQRPPRIVPALLVTAVLAPIAASILLAAGCDQRREAGRSEGSIAATGPAPAPAPAPAPVPAAAQSPAPTEPVAAPSHAAPTEPPTEPPTAAADPSKAPPSPAALGPVHRLSVLDLDGNTVSLAQFAGRPMLIEIWATWCGPCRANRNLIHRMKSEFPERLVVIGVSVDQPPAGGSAADIVRNFLKSNAANDHEFLASSEFNAFIAQRQTSNSIPKTLYVNGKGQVADLSEGVQGASWLRGMAKNLK